jgi:hypothetical protein
MSLEFFNHLSGRLEIALTEPTELIRENLINRKAPPTATIKSLALCASVFENHAFRDLTDEELTRVAFDAPEIKLRGRGAVVTHRAPNGRCFTVGELLAAVEETERQTRQQGEWFGGIDVHHVFFQGISPEDGGVWSISWGS